MTIFDDYPPINLVSKSITSENGFIIESYIKPPIDIYIQFLCTISISHIYIDTKVGIQQSEVIEIFSFCNKNTVTVKKVTVKRVTVKKVIVKKKRFVRSGSETKDCDRNIIYIYICVCRYTVSILHKSELES